MIARWFCCVTLALILALTGCAGGFHKAPIEDRGGVSSRRVKVHTVIRGDTLYSIARANGIDVGQLAKANNLRSPYTIHIGQKLYVGTPAAVASARRGGFSSKDSGRDPGARGAIANGRDRSGKTLAGGTGAGRQVAPLGPWRWPAAGTVIQRFGGPGVAGKGIDIQGQLGEPVYAANSGKVVYAGDGLLGYGNLLIIRHNELYLSAYAHNNRLLVREGETVKAGDRVAEIGDSGADSIKLHFEIRRDGAPVDPLGLLPRR